MNVAIIPARGGSRRIPGKNIRLFHGKPIIAYSIEAARQSGVFDRILVSSDDERTLNIARQCGAEVIERPENLARDEVGTQEVMAYVLRSIECNFACCIYATAPMLSPKAIELARFMLNNRMAWYAVPVGTWLRDPGQFYFGRADMFRAGAPLLDSHTVLVPIDPATECDINTEEDWQRAEQMYAALQLVSA